MMTDLRDHDGMICVIMMARRPHTGKAVGVAILIG